MLDTYIEKMLAYEIANTIVILVMIAAILIFTIWALKGDRRFKLIVSVTVVVSIVMTAAMGIELSEIILDMKNEDYITYNGEYIQRSGGLRGLTTVAVYDDQGKEIRLLRTGLSETGVYEGTVIYGKRSKVVVELSAH